MDIEKEILEIKARNTKVETDKDWETSVTRKVTIFVLTYLVAFVWLWLIHESKVALKALVPAIGYILSTLSIPIIKNIWVKYK